MRTISINGIQFAWKLNARQAKELGIKGPGDTEGMQAALACFSNDFEAAAKFVLTGCAEMHRERVKNDIPEWGLDDYTSFVEQAFDPKSRASASNLVQ